MAEGLNRVLLLGNLGADPELRTTQGGDAVLRLRIATTERYLDRNKAWQERTEWHTITVWGKRGEALHRILSKGSTIFVEGSLRTSSYDDKDGVKRWKTEIMAQNVILAGSRGARSSPAEEFDAGAARPPQAVARSGAGGSGGYGSAMPPRDDTMGDESAGGGYSGDDDIPF